MNQPSFHPQDFNETDRKLLQQVTDCTQPPPELRERILSSYDRLMARRRRARTIRRFFLAAAGVVVLIGASYLVLETAREERHKLPETATVKNDPRPRIPETPIQAETPNPPLDSRAGQPGRKGAAPAPKIKLRGNSDISSPSTRWTFESAVLTVDGEFYPISAVRGSGSVLWVTTRSGLVLFDARTASAAGVPVSLEAERAGFSMDGHAVSLVGKFAPPSGNPRGTFIAGTFEPGRSGLADTPAAARAAAEEGARK